MSTQRPLVTSRAGRLGQLGRLAGGIAGGVIGEGTRRLLQGDRPSISDLLLTPANATKLAERLAEMRGAAMKVGQLMSMDSNTVLPPEFAELLTRLRENAHHMPLGQVADRLDAAWGQGWEPRFAQFQFRPMAAASIGQVHDACLRDGRRLAIKLQYPGIRASIDSDVNNVATLLRLFNLLPAGMDLAPLLDEARRQLHQEADYRREAELLRRFRDHLAEDPRFRVPEVIDELTTPDVLAMQFLDGDAIECLAEQPHATRNRVAAALVELALREVFDWGLVQTDPNFANYLFEPVTGQIQLLDFGAVRDYPAQRVEALRHLLRACCDGSDADLARAAGAVGYLGDGDPPGYCDSVVQLLRLATEPARHDGDYDFGTTSLATRMRDILVAMRLEQKYARIPPPELLFLHRKLGGLYLLLARIRAEVPVARLVAPYLLA